MVVFLAGLKEDGWSGKCCNLINYFINQSIATRLNMGTCTSSGSLSAQLLEKQEAV